MVRPTASYWVVVNSKLFNRPQQDETCSGMEVLSDFYISSTGLSSPRQFEATTWGNKSQWRKQGKVP